MKKPEYRCKKQKPATGRLIWIDRSNKEHLIQSGPFALLSYYRSILRQDPLYAGGKFKITY